jgi:hypothetical protein
VQNNDGKNGKYYHYQHQKQQKIIDKKPIQHCQKYKKQDVAQPVKEILAHGALLSSDSKLQIGLAGSRAQRMNC